jgi:Domain of unknown function (DUF4047)
MKKLTLLVLLLCVPGFCQSVAEAARAAKEKKQSAKKVITDEDLPSTRENSAASAEGAVLDSDWTTDVERMRRAYKQVCSGAPGKTKLTEEQKNFVEEESKPLKARMDLESKQVDKLKEEMTQMKRDEEAEVAAAAGDQRKITDIHEHYAQKAKPLQQRAATSLQRVMLVVKESFAVLGDCMPSASK